MGVDVVRDYRTLSADADGDGYWSEDEIESLFQKEVFYFSMAHCCAVLSGLFFHACSWIKYTIRTTQRMT